MDGKANPVTILIGAINLSGTFFFLLWLPPVFLYIQEWLILPNDRTVFLNPTGGIYVMISSAIFGFLLLYTLIKYVVKHLHIPQNTVKDWLTNGWRGILISWIIILPLFISVLTYSFRTFTLVDQDGITIHSFSFVENIPWSKIQKIKLYAIGNCRGLTKGGVNEKFEVVTQAGTSYEFWEGKGIGSPSIETLKKVVTIAHQNNILFEVGSLNTADLNKCKTTFRGDDFRYIEEMIHYINDLK